MTDVMQRGRDELHRFEREAQVREGHETFNEYKEISNIEVDGAS